MYLILKRASASRPSGEWDDDDFDVLADGVVVGRIMKTEAAPIGSPWMWTLAFGHHEDRTPTHGYEPTREAAMAAFRQELAAGVVLRSGGTAFGGKADNICLILSLSGFDWVVGRRADIPQPRTIGRSSHPSHPVPRPGTAVRRCGAWF